MGIAEGERGSVLFSGQEQVLPLVRLINQEKDRGTRPSDYLLQLYLLIKQYWLDPRPMLKVVDGDLGHMFPFQLDETMEMLEQLGSNNPIEYGKEYADSLVIATSTTVNNYLPVDFARIAQNTNGQAINETILLRKIEDLTKLESVDPDDPEALTAHLEKIFVVLGSFLNHGPALPHPRFIVDSIVRVLHKNARNYPAEYFRVVHWLSGKALSRSEIESCYYHSVACLRLIRVATGNKLSGLDPQDHQPYAYLIHDFEHADQAYAQLQKELSSGIAKNKVYPTYERSQVDAPAA